MTISDSIKFANENPICYLATAEGDQPRVRALRFWFADETGYYFQTGSMKELSTQLQNNPKTEVCFYNPAADKSGIMLRIAGKAEFVDELQMKEKALNDRPFLKQFGITADSPRLVLFKIAHGQAYFWTWENNIKPKEFIEF